MRWRVWGVLASFAMFGGCKGCIGAEPVPEAKQDWVGAWVSEKTVEDTDGPDRQVLVIYPGGTCEYDWRDGTTETEVEGGGAARWKEDTFVCDVAPWIEDGEFRIDQAPYRASSEGNEHENTWKMKLDGYVLEKWESDTYKDRLQRKLRQKMWGTSASND